MKKISLTTVIVFFYVFALSVILYSCKEDFPDDNPETSEHFIGLYNPGKVQVLGDQACLVEMKGNKGDVEYGTRYSVYPYDYNLSHCCVIRNNKMIIGLHADFNDGPSRTGACYDLESGDMQILPFILPEEEDDYGSLEAYSVTASQSGHIFYISATRDTRYADQYTPFLVRFDPTTNDPIQAISPHAFALSQPEKGSDTEVGLIQNDLFPSADGRFVYGMMEGAGVDAGVFHTDFKIVFRYDFEMEKYERVADGYIVYQIYGITSDANYLLLYAKAATGGDVNLFTYNLESGLVEAKFHTWAMPYAQSSWNSNGYCIGGNSWLAYFDILKPEWIELVSSSTYNIEKAQFSKAEDCVYFSINGATENYLCKTDGLEVSEKCCMTNGLESNVKIDTLFAYSKEIIDWLIIR